MEFMSPEHVVAMNALLADAPSVRKACAELPGPRVLTYRLSDGPGGVDVHWTVSFDDTVKFSLDPNVRADLVFAGDWRKMIRASSASREGEEHDPGLAVEGDPAVLTEIASALAEARSCASVPVEFPKL